QNSSESSHRHASPAATNLLETSHIVPDVICAVPQGVVHVKYSNAEVCMGNTISPQEARNKPEVTFDAQGQSPPFALVMVDPDAPSRSNPIYRSWLHWLTVNAPSSERFSEGEETVPYNGPSPPPGSGPHRYVFLLMAQNGKNISKTDVSYTTRKSFNFEMFLQNNSLSQPFAANFFLSENPGNASAEKPGK
ncbi:unnamed protein product, partial [Ixodes hexagonus]